MYKSIEVLFQIYMLTINAGLHFESYISLSIFRLPGFCSDLQIATI